MGPQESRRATYCLAGSNYPDTVYEICSGKKRLFGVINAGYRRGRDMTDVSSRKPGVPRNNMTSSSPYGERQQQYHWPTIDWSLRSMSWVLGRAYDLVDYLGSSRIFKAYRETVYDI